MRNLLTPETPTRLDPSPDAPVDGATEVVEALTTEAAIAEVHDRLGPDARILDARRVLRGGIGGFFAKEHVQLHAAPGEAVGGSAGGSVGRSAGARAAGGHPGGAHPGGPPLAAAPVSETPTVPPPGAGLAGSGGGAAQRARPGGNPWQAVAHAESSSPVDRLLADADEIPDEGPGALDFAAFLRSQLGGPSGLAGPSATAAPTRSPLACETAFEAPAWPRIDPALAPTRAGDASTPSDAPELGSTDLAAVLASAAAQVRAERVDASAERGVASSEVGDASAAPTVARAPSELAPADGIPAPLAAASGAPATEPDGHAVPVVPGLRQDPPAATDGGPTWSSGALLALGMPVELVRSLEVHAPHDDIAWTMALAEALRPSCRPLPPGPAVFVGPAAAGVAEAVEAGDTRVARSEAWLTALRPGRWVHLVVGGEGWRRSIAEEPLAVSWATVDDLPDAIRCASELGMVLGYGPTRSGIDRARPLDVALAVRDLVADR